MASPISPSADLSDEEHAFDDYAGDYSTRMEELLSDDDNESDAIASPRDASFLDDVHVPDTSIGYRDQLRDVLGSDEVDDEDEEDEVERSLILPEGPEITLEEHERHPPDVLSDHTPSTPSMPSATPPRVNSPYGSLGTPNRLSKPFLHPTVSRLRSYTPQGSRLSSVGSNGTQYPGFASPSASHFSSMSRMSSVSNSRAESSVDPFEMALLQKELDEREVFRWSHLRNIGQQIYAAKDKASSLLGVPSIGSPTVLAANGFICVGTDEGKIWVFDFKQSLKCLCGPTNTAKTVGPVTALALSYDHTFVASGHATGHIQVFDLKNPQVPARSVAPTTLSVVATGRKEGHLEGSRIVSIGFVAGRHTALVSADEHGLAFYHSLGKVLFVEASDILRILGKYPLDSPPASTASVNGSHTLTTSGARKRKARYTVLAMSPLPLGTVSHPTDAFNIVAMLTPTKLVVVGLKPTPRTWFKCTRSQEEGSGMRSKMASRKGTMSWFPCVSPSNARNETPKPLNGSTASPPSTIPMLAYTWGPNLHLIRVFETKVKQTVQNKRSGKTTEAEVGVIDFTRIGKWSARDDILAAQWLNVNQVVVITASALEVYDLTLTKTVESIRFDGLSLVSPRLRHTVNGSISYADAVEDIAHSLRVYKGKIFLLTRDEVRVGTLLTWADRILSFVQQGDFLSAINLTRAYYDGSFVGNSNGLPEDKEQRKEVVGQKMRDLMTASVKYAFSEDRMTDGTHATPDNRGVDRTSLFEGLVETCCRACIALGDHDFIFETLFQEYDDVGITRIFLRQFEPFILDGDVRLVPPRITQRLVAMHANDDRPDLVERLIWHIDPACLDINQATHLCQSHHLYDALIYVYTRALRDYVAPVVELLGLIRKARKYRKAKAESMEPWTTADDDAIEPYIINAYKVYPYLANVLSGLTYPSEAPIPDDEALEAKKDVYTFLFFGRSSVWPAGEGGQLVLTSDEDGGQEPTYPYARALLQFDAEAFLHSLDIAFEDPYFNDKSQRVSRLVIVTILLEILSSDSLSQADETFVNIFIARNVPKYIQFLELAPSVLHNILVALAEDPDPNTREDRQLAAEYLLSAYTPHGSDQIVELFREAGFYRILRSWHRHEKRWPLLIEAFIDDPELPPAEIFHNVDEVLTTSKRSSKGNLTPKLMSTISHAIPQLLHCSVVSTASLLDSHLPELHQRALDALGEGGDRRRYNYLRHLLGPPDSNEEYWAPAQKCTPSTSVPPALRQLFISLQCQYFPKGVIRILEHLPPELVDWDTTVQTCEDQEVYDAVIWALNQQGHPMEALTKVEEFDRRLSTSLADILTQDSLTSHEHNEIQRKLEAIKAVGDAAIKICLERSQGVSATEVPLEDIWFRLLSSQIKYVQTVSACSSSRDDHEDLGHASTDALTTLRSLVQKTFNSLVSISSTRAVSFPRLFKRLVNSTTSVQTSVGAHYNEFRTILTGMLESYRSDGDMLILAKHLVDRDLFDTAAEHARQRVHGWSASRGICAGCQKPVIDLSKADTPDFLEISRDTKVIVSRTGALYHFKCYPSDQ